MKITDEKIFTKTAFEVGEFVLGKVLVRKTADGTIIRGRITEVEMYTEDDSACHAYNGKKTKRNAPMFERGGTIYVYLCYGIYNLLNIVCNKPDIPQGLLIRGVNDIFGSGRVGRYFAVDQSLRGEHISTSDKIWLEDDNFVVKPEDIQKFKRVGIDYAEPKDVDNLWRWRIITKR